MAVRVVSLVRNRPIRSLMTIRAAVLALEKVAVSWDFKILDQASGPFTRFILRQLSKDGRISVVFLNKNIGMAQGWKLLIEDPHDDLYLMLENDWFCVDSKALGVGIREIKSDSSLWIVKLRSLNDIDNFGKDSPFHSPYNVHGFEDKYESRFYSQKVGHIISSEWTDFTFNPILFESKVRELLLNSLADNPESQNRERSGESVIDAKWRDLRLARALVLDGDFYHTGFYDKSAWLTRFPFYVLTWLKSELQSFRSRMKSSTTDSQE